MRFIGSINGDMGKYVLLTSPVFQSLQLGDSGLDSFKLSWLGDRINPHDHKLLSGIKDNTATKTQVDSPIASCWGEAGMINGVFFISGGGINLPEDKILNLDYFEGGEIPESEHSKVIALYKETKPELVATYEIPYFLYSYLNKPIPQKSVTQRLLERLLDIHRPRTWIFNNRVTGARIEYPQTTFIGLGEGEFVDIEVSK